MRRAFQKNIYRTIKKSLGRYMAIFAIIALGVGFFTGLKASKPDMMRTGQEYLDEQHFYDYRLISTWGFTEEEISDIQELSSITEAEGAVWEDFLYTKEDGSEGCLKAMSITEKVNRLTLEEGRLPQKENECVLDAYRFSKDMIGREITISSENSKETKDSFKYDTYTVTGLVRTPVYLNMERGTTTIGSGKIDGFLFLPLEGFSYEYFKEAYVVSTVSEKSFSKEYEDFIDILTDSLTEETEQILNVRYQEELTDARETLDDAKEELLDAKKELEDETKKAKRELADAKEELLDGEQKLTEARQELEDGQEELERNRKKIIDGEAELNQGEAELVQGEAGYQQGLLEYQTGYGQYEAGIAQLSQNRESYEQAKAAKEQIEAAMQEQLGEGAKDALEQNKEYQVLAESVASFEKNEAILSETKVQLDQAKAQLDQVRAQLDESNARLSAAREELLSGKRQINDAERKLEEGRQEIIENEEKIADGWIEYEDGKKELEEEIANAQKEIKDAEEKIADGEKELSEIEEPELFVLDRSANPGYAGYESDVSIVEGVSRIFPIFFFLIAALVCSTTMTRMVDDERTQIGTLRALGYSQGAIFWKYTIYSGSAAGFGATVGYFLGTRLFPMAIWIAYDMLYGFADIVIVDNLGLFFISLAVSLICSVGTTFAACRMELIHAPAELIRPKTPSAGKRIFLEKIPFFWKRLKFLHKVSARNVFRFKKRMIMMIMGIAGCTALVIAGFGVKDSVSNIVNNQYDKIFQYDISAVYGNRITDQIQQEIKEEYGNEIENSAVLMEVSAEISASDGIKTISLLVSEGEEITGCIDFHLGNQPVSLPKKGEILIDKRLAEILEAQVGDEISLMSGEEQVGPFRVSGIFENYTFHYAYLTAETYEDCFKDAYEPKSMYLSFEKDADVYGIASYLSNMEDASNVTVVADMRARVENMMQSMNFIVALIIGCAAALAFIVLFNLGNINISERVREIATLKVLGFYPRETGAYVFRENVVLSCMGILCGVPLGILLHRFVMIQLKIEMVTFEINIRPISYLYAVLSVLIFTVCVDVIMRRKINRIDMAESLKSIE